jgi:hypothetical protein
VTTTWHSMEVFSLESTKTQAPANWEWSSRKDMLASSVKLSSSSTTLPAGLNTETILSLKDTTLQVQLDLMFTSFSMSHRVFMRDGTIIPSMKQPSQVTGTTDLED